MNSITENIWGSFRPGSPDWTVMLTGDETVQIKREGKNAWITHLRNETTLEEYRYVTRPEDDLHLSPILLEYPMVVKPVTRLSILPEMQLNAYIEVPLYLNIGVGASTIDYSLAEIPLHTLSKSFFGNPDSG